MLLWLWFLKQTPLTGANPETHNEEEKSLEDQKINGRGDFEFLNRIDPPTKLI